MIRNATRAFPSALAFAAFTAGSDDLVALPCKDCAVSIALHQVTLDK